MKKSYNPRHDESEEEWESEAHLCFSKAAESEFTRLKLELKRKAGLLDKPSWYSRVIKFMKGLFGSGNIR